MFTGLIEKKGKVISNHPAGNAYRLVIEAPFKQLQIGESIAINGVCLTLLTETSGQLAFDVSPETLKVTTLGELRQGECVNMERAMAAATRFGGHYVSGHVDTTACLLSAALIGDYIELTVGDFSVPADLYLLPKGSITLNGVSLTINEVINGCIKVMLVPHTVSMTTLSQLQQGQRLNVEFDYLTRIVAHQVRTFIQTTNPYTSRG